MALQHLIALLQLFLELDINMTFYYSKTTNSFYNSEINESTPEDKVEITETQWQDLLQEQSNGKVISSDEKGNPIEGRADITLSCSHLGLK